MNDIRSSVTVHRGADTIGGSCIRISHGADSIILDYGMPLMASGGHDLEPGATDKPSIENQILLDIVNENNKPLAFVISHAHPDHYGLIDYIPNDIPVYISNASKALMNVGNIFYDKSMHVDRLNDCSLYSPGKSFEIGPFKVTAFLMDHSAFGACSILVEVDGKSVFYTGDFRGHGRKAGVNDRVMRSVKNPDVMLMEGTTLDDGHPSTFKNEASVEQALVEQIQHANAPVFVAGSGSNIDRIVSLYRAAKRTGRELVIDLYQMYLLEQLKAFSPGLPPHKGDALRVYYPKNQRDSILQHLGPEVLERYAPRHMNKSKVDFTSSKYIFRVSNSVTSRLCAGFMDQGIKPSLVYSMWKGYMDRQPAFSKIASMTGSQWIYMHTSGHAYSDTLRYLANGISPKKLIPVHTLKGDQFRKNYNNVHQLNNNESINF
jgi:ribonuclease J